MADSYSLRLQTYLSRIGAALGGKDALVAGFTRQLFALMPVVDLERLDAARAAGIAEGAYSFFAARTPGEPSIRIFHDAGHLVVELINDDMPFLVDSLSAEITRLGFTIFETIHPIFHVTRAKDGKLKSVAETGQDKTGTQAESFIHFELSALPDNMTEDALIERLKHVLRHVRAAVTDWPRMIEQAHAAGAEMKAVASRFNPEDGAEAIHFLNWLIERNFVFLGYAAFAADGPQSMRVVTGSELGVCRMGMSYDPYSSHHLIDVTKTDEKSLVHRSALMDTIIVKKLDEKGAIIGEHRFFGLFTSTVYYQSTETIPFVRRKVAAVLARAGYAPGSHDGKSLKAILEFMPRDELFHIGEEELFETSLGILSIEARPGVRLFVHKEPSGRFISCMVFVPREYFSTSLRKQIRKTLEQAFAAQLENFYTQMTESALARVHMILRTTPGHIPEVNVAEVEAEIARFTMLWSDLLKRELVTRHGEHKAESLIRAYGNAFPTSYINRYDIGSTVHDIEKMTRALDTGSMTLELYQSKQDDDRTVHLKIYHPREEIALSDIVPVLEHFGFRVIEEHPFTLSISHRENATLWLRDFKLTLEDPTPIDISRIKPVFEEALIHVWNKTMESDRFNALITRAALNWREVSMLRAYARYMRQIGFTYSQPAIEQTFCAHPHVARELASLFHARFSPGDETRAAREQATLSELENQLTRISSLSEDVIIRRYMALMRATLRTNFFQKDATGAHKPVFSFKLDSAAVPELPKPVPYAEIFVYSPRVEGIHLRGGKVARGGLRWSDRHEDFRTEVLGLMKAQMVKNSVIVPVGSKGGFVVKQPPKTGGREAFQQEGIACYTLYLQGMLDITDNIVSAAIVPPDDVVRHDGDDPYLVVAADKGTATFSDTANAVSRAYGFWLDDAFASGGSAGYDHKAMGITARGAWVSVVRHFRELGKDISRDTFTVAGIGDMSGDVFGNGMLLSENIRLIAAFNHLHIFIDPNPDAAGSFLERKRLFELPRSGWKDYDPGLISAGGGIYERAAKQIVLSPEAQAALGVDKAEFSPDELIKAILRAPVELLWNGGIGTYVKAEDETHEQVGDRGNNAVRVGGKDLRAQIVGEGGNLGFTQKGRIEYARAGGRLNTDAIDNSGGVDCSDHEVNIKIALRKPVTEGRLRMDARDALLERMTEEVARLVLKDNQLQTQAISVAAQQGASVLESQQRLIRNLEKRELLDRSIEFLPTDKQINELIASGFGLTRPELAVLLAYSKIAIYRDIVATSLPDEPYFASDLARYFPREMQMAFKEDINAHPLKREIIATVATNSLVNRMGITFFFDVMDESGLPAREVAAAYSAVRDAFGLRGLWQDIEQLDARVTPVTQGDMLIAIQRMVERATLFLLRKSAKPINTEQLALDLTPKVQEFRTRLSDMHSAATRDTYARLEQDLIARAVPQALASMMASLDMLSSTPDIAAIAASRHVPLSQAGTLYFALDERLKLGWLREQAVHMKSLGRWDRLALRAIIQGLYDQQQRLTSLVLESGGNLEQWSTAHDAGIQRLERTLADLHASAQPDIAGLLVALERISQLV